MMAEQTFLYAHAPSSATTHLEDTVILSYLASNPAGCTVENLEHALGIASIWLHAALHRLEVAQAARLVDGRWFLAERMR
jgi:hypothetical protein